MLNNGFSHPSAATIPISDGKLGQNNPLISADKLKQLYAAMLESRLIAESARRNSPASRGMLDSLEACEVGCTIDLRSADTVALLPHQCIGHRGAKSASGANLIADHPGGTGLRADAPTAMKLAHSGNSSGQLAMATGVAFAYAEQKSTNVVVAFAEATRIKQAQDSMAFAGEKCLPIIYVELTGRSRTSRKSVRRGQENIHRIATMQVDRNDVIAIYRVAYEAIDKARRGAGPSLIQCVSYDLRVGGRRSTGSHTFDPIAYMEHYLKKKYLWSSDFKRSIELAIRS